MTTEYGGRTFDRAERVDARSFDHLFAAVHVSREDRIILAELAELKVRVAALEAGTPPAPAPAPGPAPLPKATVWSCGMVLDQGQFGMCVGYAWAGWAMTAPGPRPIVPGRGGDDEDSTADLLYDKAQDDDGTPEDPQSGASTTGGAQAARQLGLARSYTWALNVGQVVAAIVGHGPVVVGTPWRSTMMEPDGHGVLDVADKSKDVGGHEFLLPRYYPAGSEGNPSATVDMVGMRQSWGDWGPLHGDALIPVDGLADLLADGGDAAVPVKA